MAQTSDIISVNITTASANPTQANFGTPMIVAYHTAWTDRVRTYTTAAAMLTDGFTTADEAYKSVSAVFQQTPRPPKCKVGRRASAFTQVTTLTLTSSTAADIYNISVNGNALTRTVPGSSTTTAEATAVAALITALTSGVSGVTAVAASNVITCTQTTAGKLTEFSNYSSNIQVRTTTASVAGLAADLAAIFAADTDWYGFTLDSNSIPEVLAAASFAETNTRLYLATTNDWDVSDPSNTTTDLGSQLKTLGYRHTSLWYSGKSNLSRIGPAMMGSRFTANPGSDTWAFKTLTGVPVDTLATLSANAQNSMYTVADQKKRVNTYSVIQGLSGVYPGIACSGDWVDTIRGTDWFASVVSVAWIALLFNNGKIPFTEQGADQVRGMLINLAAGGIRVGLFAASPAPVVTVPAISSVSSTDRASRNLPGVTMAAQLAGAIHTTTLSVTVSS